MQVGRLTNLPLETANDKHLSGIFSTVAKRKTWTRRSLGKVEREARMLDGMRDIALKKMSACMEPLVSQAARRGISGHGIVRLRKSCFQSVQRRAQRMYRGRRRRIRIWDMCHIEWNGDCDC